MNICDKLFIVGEDYQPEFTPVLVNLPPYKQLYINDKTEDKSDYSKQLAYIWLTSDMRSPYFDSDTIVQDSKIAAFGSADYEISPTLLLCLEDYKKRQSTAESRALESALSVVDEVGKSLRNQDRDTSQEESLITEVNKELDKLSKNLTQSAMQTKAQLIMFKQELIEKMNKNYQLRLKLIPDLTKSVTDLMKLREQLRNLIIEIDGNNNKDKISDFMIHEFIKDDLLKIEIENV
jgi:hypothetical protein